MKKTVVVLALLLLVLLQWAPSAHAQRPFDLRSIGLVEGQRMGRGTVGVGQSPAAAIKALGWHTTREKLLDEATEDSVEVLHYRTNALYFVKDKLEGFELNDNTLALARADGQVFGVSSKLTLVLKKSGAPAAPAGTTYLLDNRPLTDLTISAEPGTSDNVNYQLRASNDTRFGDTNLDGWFEILFDKNNRVIRIDTSPNNS